MLQKVRFGFNIFPITELANMFLHFLGFVGGNLNLVARVEIRIAFVIYNHLYDPGMLPYSVVVLGYYYKAEIFSNVFMHPKVPTGQNPHQFCLGKTYTE